MTKTTNLFLFLAIAVILFASPLAMDEAFAKDDKPKKDKDDKNDNNPFKELWDAIADLQAQIANLTFVQDDLDEPVLELQVDPNSNAPALVVSDGTDDLFLVNEDGSIQIGSNTVVIRPDGKITAGGQPLVVQGSVGQTSSLQEWQTSDGTRVGTINPSGVLTANSFVGDGSGLTGIDAIDVQQQIDDLKANEILGFYQKTDMKLGNDQILLVQVNCDEGDSVTGGGFVSAGVNSVIRDSSSFNSGGDGWRNVWIFADDNSQHTTTVECADYAPVHVP